MNDLEIWPSIEGIALALREAESDEAVPSVTRDVAMRDQLDAERLALLGHLHVGA